ncbi:glycosyltransferase family 39 protein [Inconstantimicrobium mannanitabidum]|uniref:Uncharacterized protein n=1 Tax=Inconstantimicrobium mannanitabidum TaxID=1604901 RepID=A0ACB5RF08_9CLOT|nr:glycosyltransferase family 39 protein [Clostridium sp. TW13]GKX67782.1 hypothetical protein rsdtw13_30400 [Clostridium sp. TW13]
MKKNFEISFTKFVIYSLRFIFFTIAIVAAGQLINYLKFKNSMLSVALIAFYIILGIGVYYGLNKKVKTTTMLLVLIILGLILRIVWSFSVNSIPVSDFNTAYRSAGDLLKGDFSMMKGTAYFGRFPHLIGLVLYFAFIRNIFGGSSLLVLKIINILFSTSTIFLVYLICKEIFSDKKRVIIGTFLAAVFPTSILYTAVYCTENMAIPFYLGSIYYFFLVVKNKKKEEYLLLSGCLLLIGHLWRSVAQVMIVAYLLYIIIYYQKKNILKFKACMYICISFIIPFVIISNTFIWTGMTDRPLWSGSEPGITSVLKGSNIPTGGRWNDEDAKFIEANLKNEKLLVEESKKKIIERYTTTAPSDLVYFVFRKVTMQWKEGDFGAAFWAQLQVPQQDVGIDVANNGVVWYQLFHLTLLILIIRGLFRKQEYLEKKLINLFYIIFCGYGLTFLILESQERYAFIVNWLFIILPLAAVKGDEASVGSN